MATLITLSCRFCGHPSFEHEPEVGCLRPVGAHDPRVQCPCKQFGPSRLRYAVLIAMALATLLLGCSSSVESAPEPAAADGGGGAGGEDSGGAGGMSTSSMSASSGSVDVCDDHNPCTVDSHPPGHCDHAWICGGSGAGGGGGQGGHG